MRQFAFTKKSSEVKMSDNKKFSDAVLSVVLDAVPEDAKPLGS